MIPKHQQLQFDLQPASQRVVIEIQKSKYPDTKSKYEHFRTFSGDNRSNAIKAFEKAKKTYKGYRFRIRRLTFGTFTAEQLFKVEYLK